MAFCARVAEITGHTTSFVDDAMPYTEALHADRQWWYREDARRALAGIKREGRIRLVSRANIVDDDLV